MLVKLPSDIIEVIVTKEMLQQAKETSHRGSMNHHSMLEGARNVEGLLGELAVQKYLPMLVYAPNENYDFKTPPGVQELTLDVKNKFDVKRYGARPRLDWDCTIFGYEATKKCHVYLFTSTNEDNSRVWLKGFITKRTFVTNENLYKAGSFRKTTQGSVEYRKDNYVVQVAQLGSVAYLKTKLEKHLTKPQDSANL